MVERRTTKACPRCDSREIRRLIHNNRGASAPTDKRYSCADCRQYFNEPVERPYHGDWDGTPTHGLARKLAKMGEQGGG